MHMTPEVTHENNRGTRPNILSLIPLLHRIFLAIALIVESVLGAVIYTSSGFVQILALIFFFIFMLITVILVYKLSNKEVSSLQVGAIKRTTKAGDGIVKYWANRQQAYEEIKEEILKAEKEVFINGIVLSGFLESIKPDIFIEKLATRFFQKRELKLTMVVLHRKERDLFKMTKQYQKKLRGLKSLSQTCLKRLRDFEEDISEKFGEKRNLMKRIKFMYYTEMIPHHCIIKIDDKLYVSSYFSHGMGRAACLLELKSIGEGCLYERFEKEIKYIKSHSKYFEPSIKLKRKFLNLPRIFRPEGED